MKKVFLILTLFLSCYFVYTKTEGNKKNYLVIGDSLSKGINEYGVASYGYSDFTPRTKPPPKREAVLFLLEVQ